MVAPIPTKKTPAIPDEGPLVKARDIFLKDGGFHPAFIPILPETYNRFALHRAITKGVRRIADGRRIKCPAIKVGEPWATRPSWVAWYFAELSKTAEQIAAEPDGNAQQNGRQHEEDPEERANAILVGAGILAAK